MPGLRNGFEYSVDGDIYYFVKLDLFIRTMDLFGVTRLLVIHSRGAGIFIHPL